MAQSLGRLPAAARGGAPGGGEGQRHGRAVAARPGPRRCRPTRRDGSASSRRPGGGQEARALYAAAGDRGGEAWALNRLGNVLYQQGELVKAERFYREAEAVFEEIGDKASLAALLNNTAEVFFLQGQLERAGDTARSAPAPHAKHSADPRRASSSGSTWPT